MDKQIPSEQLELKKELLAQTERVGTKSIAHKIIALHPGFVGMDRTSLYQWPKYLENNIQKPKTIARIRQAVKILSEASPIEIKQARQKRKVAAINIPDQNVLPIIKIVAGLDLEHLAISDLIFLLKTQDRINVNMTADLVSALLSAQKSELSQT